MENLKPCPFCGNPKPAFIYDLELAPHGVHCTKCGTFVKFSGVDGHKDKTFGDTMEKIAVKWNRRESWQAKS